jgi:prepilin-type N-terminal cleavage/methylation domain-containing protein
MSQKGFTLVELAIALMIIGLLIGAVLKGKELIQNARVTQTVRQYQSYDTALTAFRTVYGSIPGDIVNPTTRIPDCAASPCNVSGDGNHMVDNTAEQLNYWMHLAKANLISGIDATKTTWTDIAPASPLGGQFFLIFQGAGRPVVNTMDLLTSADPGFVATVMKPSDAAQIDRKMDDGLPLTGDILNIANDTTCGDGSATNLYLEASKTVACGLNFNLYF